MLTCASCRHQEYEGELFCSNCGARLVSEAGEGLSTVAFTDTSRLREKAVTQPPASGGPKTEDLSPGQIALLVAGKAVLLEGRPQYTLGREGADNDPPDVNLGPHGAREKGVSRKHALLRVDRRQLLLMDLGSSNGTWLNGTQVAANEPVRLESGDEIRLGKLSLRVRFNL